MAKVTVDFRKNVGPIKPVHGVGQPPFMGIDFSMVRYLKEAHIPFSRLHDVGGPYGGNLYVDIPNVFRDFDADPADPNAYDFAFTDLLLASLAENEVEPFFRLGVTIENYCAVKAYRIHPPKDYLKWAKICEGVIRHYTQGWAEGFHYKITYWEIWNEPDNGRDNPENMMWTGTKEDYFELYHVAASYLKGRFPHLKIGGYGNSGFYAIANAYIAAANSSPRKEYFITFLEEFLAYIKERNTPFDFFSWHTYSDVTKNREYAAYARKKLDEAGYSHVETSCNEWNSYPKERGTAFHAAQNTASLIGFQHSPVDTAMFYDARLGISIYGGLFNPMTRTPYPLYYGFKAFGELYVLGTEAASSTDDPNLYVLAATDGKTGGLLIANIGPAQPLQLALLGGEVRECFIIDEENTFTPCPLPAEIGENTVLYCKV